MTNPLPFETHEDTAIKVNGTSLVGTVEADYWLLVRVFGEPMPGIPGEGHHEWHLRFADGTVATVYDRHGSDRWNRWQVGGYHLKAAGLVQAAIDDVYDGPPDGDAWSGGFARNH
jgi:hypothetical protein